MFKKAILATALVATAGMASANSINNAVVNLYDFHVKTQAASMIGDNCDWSDGCASELNTLNIGATPTSVLGHSYSGGSVNNYAVSDLLSTADITTGSRLVEVAETYRAAKEATIAEIAHITDTFVVAADADGFPTDYSATRSDIAEVNTAVTAMELLGVDASELRASLDDLINDFIAVAYANPAAMSAWMR